MVAEETSSIQINILKPVVLGVGQKEPGDIDGWNRRRYRTIYPGGPGSSKRGRDLIGKIPVGVNITILRGR